VANQGYLRTIEERLAGHPDRERWIAAAVEEREVGRRLAARLRERGLAPGSRVVEVGCGVGGIPIALEAAGFRATGLEIGAELLALARQRAEEEGASPGLVLGSAFELPLRSGSVDAVVLENVVEHFVDWRAAVRETARVLRAGGLVSVTLPNRFGLRTIRSDPHWGIPGLVLLPRPLAAALVTRVLRRAETYDVFDMPSLAELQRAFAAEAIDVQLVSGLDRFRERARAATGLDGRVRRALATWFEGRLGAGAYLAYRRFASTVWILEGAKVG
jgi:ubiquinone/menaquinone biosynthesis C-methylase UbiE